MAMNLDELVKTANAMVAKGKGILAADESSGTIKKRFDTIKIDSTEDSRRDYREMLFRTSDALKNNISGVILYDETLRQNAKDGTPLVKILTDAGSIPGIKVDKGTKPLPFCPGELITEGLDGLGERLAEYYKLGARFAKWRAVIDIAPGIPSYTCIRTNSHALARYAALCQENNLVPIVEPEVLMDGGHDIDTCMQVTQWALKTVFEDLYYQRVKLEGIVLKPNMVISGKKAPTRAGYEDDQSIEGLRAGRRSGHRIPFRRPVERGSDDSSRSDEQDGHTSLGSDLLLWPRASARSAQCLGRQDRQCRRGTARFCAPRPYERPCGAGFVEARPRKGRVISITPRHRSRREDRCRP